MLILLVASVVLGVSTTLFLRSFLVNRLDQQLSAAKGRYSASLERGQNNPGGSDADADNAVPGQSTGTLGVRLVSGGVAQAAVVDSTGKNEGVRFSAGDVAQLRSLPIGHGSGTRELSTLGDYRLQAVPGRDGDVQVTGLPLAPIAATLTRLIVIEASLFGLLLVAAAVVTGLVVKHTMRPLARLTETAVEVSQLPLTAAGTALPAAAIPHDPATEVDQMAAAFGHMLEHVRSALSARDSTERRLRAFVADASHELRTPLATVSANAEFIGRSDADVLSPPATEALDRITSAAGRMGHLVADLLLLARLDAGRPLGRERVDLTWLLLAAVDEARVAGTDHRWRLDLPEDVVTLTGDPDRLQRVVANLLSNARVHTPEGTTVTSTLRLSGDQATIIVCDNGPGVPPEQQTELFQRFTRGDSSRSRQHGSTGLGLAIARGIAIAHGGTLQVGDTSGGGASFLLRLPLDRAEQTSQG